MFKQQEASQKKARQKLIVTANKVPFMAGGADYHIQGLVDNLERHGHQVEMIRFPFRFSPESDIERLMAFCEGQNFNHPNGVSVDKVISLQFPSYGVAHDDHRVWIMHQHRAVYELYDQQPQTPELEELRNQIVEYDNRVLSGASRLFANSGRVAERLQQYNDLKAQPLYHPPHGAERFYHADAYDYIFCPSRLERLKRQDLLIEAARYLQTPARILIGGDGGQREYYQGLIDQYDLGERVRLIGRFSEEEKLALYARCLGVFFAPFDEDYGYITLEAMLSEKPVITCHDSGGPLEFVTHGENGFVNDPEPRQIAESIDQIYNNRQRSREMGREGKSRYNREEICWDKVVETLLAE